MQPDFVDQIFDYMSEHLTSDEVDPLIAQHVKNEFTDISFCSNLYLKVYNARLRLDKRLRTQEDRDVLEILDSIESIMRYLSKKMYYYGTLDLAGQAGCSGMDFPQQPSKSQNGR